jgi:hypothetical protein
MPEPKKRVYAAESSAALKVHLALAQLQRGNNRLTARRSPPAIMLQMSSARK